MEGEAVDSLKGSGTIRHDVAFTGNVTVINRRDVIDIAEKMKASRGLPQSRLRSSTPTSPLIDLTKGIEYQSHAVDVILIIIGNKKTSAELVIMPEAVNKITVLSMD